MKHITLQKIAGTTLIAFTLCLLPAPALAVSTNIVSETKNLTTLTVAQLKDLAVIYNPTNKSYALNQKKLDLTAMTTANNLRNTQSSINSSNNITDDVDNSSSATIQAALDALQAQLASDPTNAVIQAQITALQLQLASVAASENASYSSSISSIENGISTVTQLNNTLDSLQDEQDDLDKTTSDWETQVRMIIDALCIQVAKSEANIAILEEQIQLADKALQLAQVQQELGMAVSTDVLGKQTEKQAAEQALATAQESLSTIKRNINVMIGRNQGSPLEITTMNLPVVLTDAPAYTDDLIKKFISVNYTLKTYERSIGNYKSEVEGETDSDVRQEADNNIAAVQLNIEEKERSIANELKSQLAKINSDKAAYEKSQLEVSAARKNNELAQTQYDLGMITGAELLSTEISLKNAQLTNMTNGYNYYLDWQEYYAMEKGVDLSTYSSYRM